MTDAEMIEEVRKGALAFAILRRIIDTPLETFVVERGGGVTDYYYGEPPDEGSWDREITEDQYNFLVNLKADPYG